MVMDHIKDKDYEEYYHTIHKIFDFCKNILGQIELIPGKGWFYRGGKVGVLVKQHEYQTQNGFYLMLESPLSNIRG